MGIQVILVTHCCNKELRSLFVYIVTVAAKVIFGSQKWHLITLSRQLPSVPLLPFSFLSMKSELSTLFFFSRGFQRRKFMTSPSVLWRYGRRWNLSVLQKYAFPILLYIEKGRERATEPIYIVLSNAVRYSVTRAATWQLPVVTGSLLTHCVCGQFWSQCYWEVSS